MQARLLLAMAWVMSLRGIVHLRPLLAAHMCSSGIAAQRCPAVRTATSKPTHGATLLAYKCTVCFYFRHKWRCVSFMCFRVLLTSSAFLSEQGLNVRISHMAINTCEHLAGNLVDFSTIVQTAQSIAISMLLNRHCLHSCNSTDCLF